MKKTVQKTIYNVLPFVGREGEIRKYLLNDVKISRKNKLENISMGWRKDDKEGDGNRVKGTGESKTSLKKPFYIVLTFETILKKNQWEWRITLQ